MEKEKITLIDVDGKETELELNRAWPNLSEDAFHKMQDLQAVVSHNDETIKALDDSIRVHGLARELLVGEEVAPITEQFDYIVKTHGDSRDNLVNYNENAKYFIELAKEVTDPEKLDLLESMLKIVAFK